MNFDQYDRAAIRDALERIAAALEVLAADALGGTEAGAVVEPINQKESREFNP